MERVKLLLPATFPFSAFLTMRITDLNYGGHVGNDVFLSLAHEARQQFLQFYHYSELNFEGAGLIMADAVIEYKRELSYGDQLRISVAANSFDRVGFDIFYLFEVKFGESWVPAAKAKTGMVCFDYTERKRVPVPAAAVKKMQGLMQ